MGEKSTVTKANTKSPSVRTTIPEKIVKEMNLQVSDILDWTTETQQDGKRIAKLRKLE